MGDIIRFQEKFYVLASSAFADDRTRVLKFGETFGVFNRYGDIETVGKGQLGLFHMEARYLDRLTLRLNGQTPLLLASTVRDDNAFLSVDLTNVDFADKDLPPIPRGTVHVYRSKFLSEGACHEQFRVTNYGLADACFSLSIEFGADFADIFEVRGSQRPRKGQFRPVRLELDKVALSYLGLDSVLRTTCLQFSPLPTSLSETAAVYTLQLRPKEEYTISLMVGCERNSARVHRQVYGQALTERDALSRAELFGGCKITTSSKSLNQWLSRSESDLRMLIQGNPEGAYPYAGVPWFNTVFGRDGIITALECLWINPTIAQGVLKYLATTQATEIDPERDAEPGKIVHEIRRGEMATLHEVPFERYYGSVDSTPLFVLLAGNYFLRSNDLEFLKSIWPNILRALEWIDKYGDSDGDGFVEYSRQSSEGLSQQGWKDASDSIFHADGQLAMAPIALCEVQGYVFAAKQSVSLIARALGETHYAALLEKQAAQLRERFEEQFWSDELGSYVLALDGEKKQCRVRSSNAGHALFCNIASKERAARSADTLLSEVMYSGWGIRTIAAGEARYNPMSYHNGSVWPHDNAIIAHGLSLYGFQSKAVEVLSGLYEASLHVELHQLPELFCGFHKRAGSGGPTLYPVACSPQAWAAGSVFLLFQAALGVSIHAAEHAVRFSNPTLPPNLDGMTIHGLKVADASVDILIARHRAGFAVEVLRREGDLEIVKLA